MTPTRSRPAPSAPATVTPDRGHDGQGHRGGHEDRRQRPTRQGLVGALAPVLADRRTPPRRAGPAGIELAMAVAATVTPVSRAVDTSTPTRFEQSLLDQREGHQRPHLGHDGQGQPPPAEMVEIVRRPRELAGATGERPQGETGERQPHDVLQPRPGAPKPRTPRRRRCHVAAGSTRILTCSSGRASASKAPGTPSRSTVPVIIGDTSISPSARARRAPANSSAP